MTRSELVTEYRRLIDQPHENIVTSTMANADINTAYRELINKIVGWNYRAYYTSSTITTTANVAYVALPSDCIWVNKLMDSACEQLPHKDLELFDISLSAGTPLAWDTAGRKIYFTPTASSALTYTIWYTYMPSNLSSNSSTPEFIPGFEDIIALKAAINSKLIREEEAKDMVQLQYGERLNALRLAIMTQQTSSSKRVIGSSYDIGEY